MLKRLLITGAAGGLGTAMRHRLSHVAETLRLSDISDMGEAGDNEEIVICDLADEAAVAELVKDCDGILHLGGMSLEDTFEKINNSNIHGVYNLYEAARLHGMPRIIFASSNHTVGFHPQNKMLNAESTTRPDGLYGVSKLFGESMASMYHDKFGQETAIVRIGSCFPEPTNHRMLSTWMSYDDFGMLIKRVFDIQILGCPIIYGVSDNDKKWWDNSLTSYIGWSPKDNSEVFREKVEATAKHPDINSNEAKFQGGFFADDPIYK
jgi:uronate dehydrogenase